MAVTASAIDGAAARLGPAPLIGTEDTRSVEREIRPSTEMVPLGNAKIPATTYFPERLPSQYLRRWRA